MKHGRRGALNVAALLALSALIAAALMGPAGAHKYKHIWKDHIKPKLQNPGVINDSSNPVDWTKLKNVPGDLADGTDDGITSIDPTTTQTRVNGSCGVGSSIRVINQDGTVECETDDAGGGGVSEVGGAKAVTGTSPVTTSSTSFVDLPGANLNITVPAGQTMLISAEFSAESACYNSGGGHCTVQILIGNAAGAPDVGSDFAFDSADGNTETSASWEGHSVTRVRTLGAGNYTVQVQWGVSPSGATLRLDDWTLFVSRNLVAP